MSERVYNTLFLCTHNSARSILAEGLLNTIGKGRFKGYSAGSHPSGRVNPLTLFALRDFGISTIGFRSKSWNEFARFDAPRMDFIFTVCDRAAGEVCPVWPGNPVTAHWGVEDPSLYEGNEEETLREFKRVALILKRRIELFINLPLSKLDTLSIQEKLKVIGGSRA